MAHHYFLGSSGSGKSTLIKQRLIDNIRDGHGVCFIDPHGDDTDDVLKHVPYDRIKDTILLDPTQLPIKWNVFKETKDIPLTATMLSDTIKDAWGYNGQPTPVMDMYLYFTIASLMENKKTLYETLNVLLDTDYRTSLSFTDPVLEKFWAFHMSLTAKEQREAISSTINKFFTLFADERIRQLFNSYHAPFNLSRAVSNKIIFLRLPQGYLGTGKVSLIGSVLLSILHLTCMRRKTTKPFHIYIDEVQHFSPTTLIAMLSGVRKFNVHITVAHQSLHDIKPQLYASLMSNCAERCIFRISPEDSERLQIGKRGLLDLHEFEPYRYRRFEGASFTDHSTIPLTHGDSTIPEKIVEHTRQAYC